MAGIEKLLVGRVLGGRYLIEEVIGRGGMGAVYRALDERLDRQVALKVITAADSADDQTRERLRARFFREARSAAALPHHPNVVPVYDFGSDEELGLDYLVMELLRGSDLATRLARSQAPSLAASLKILLEAARGVAVGHRKGLIHRDIKPGNIYLTEPHVGEVQVRVVDFGIAKVADDEDTLAQLTQDGRAPHSPAYASPEQLRGLGQLTPASDVFSLGAVGYQLLTGQRPYSESDRNRMSLGMPVEPPSAKERNPAVPGSVDELLRRALEFDAERRYADAGEMADALEHAIRTIADETVEPYLSGAAIVTGSDEAVDTAEETRLLGAEPAGDEHDDRTLLAPSDSPSVTEPTPPPPPARDLPPPDRPVETVSTSPVASTRRRPPPGRKSRSGALIWGAVATVLTAAGIVAYVDLQDDGGGALEIPPPPDSVVIETPENPDVDEPAVPSELDAYLANQEGRRQFTLGRFDSAAVLFRRAVDVSPLNSDYHRNLGLAMLRLNQVDDAEGQFQRAIELAPTRALPYESLSRAQLAAGDTTGAIISLQRYLERDTSNSPERSQVIDRLEYLEATLQERQLPPLLGERVAPDSSVSDSLATPSSVPRPDSIRPPG